MKTFKIVILSVAALLLVAGIGAYVVVRAAFPPEKVAALVREHGSAALGREVSVESVGIGIFPRLKLGVRGVRLANAPGFSAEPAVTLESLDLSISWLSLLRFSPEIVGIRLRAPDILYEVDASGRNNLEGLGGVPDSSIAETPADTALPQLPAGVALRAFVIQDGRIRYRDAANDLEVTLGNIRQEASLTLDAGLEDVRTAGRLEVREISLRDGTSGLRKGGVRFAVEHDVRLDLPGDSLRIESLEISLQNVRARIGGTLKEMTGSAPVADLRLSAPELSIPGLLREIPRELAPRLAGLRAEGTVSLEARVAGALDSTLPKSVVADVTLRDGAFGPAGASRGIRGMTMDLALRGDTLHLAELAFNTGDERLRMETMLTGILDSVPFLDRFRLEGGLDLGELFAVGRAVGGLDDGVRVAGVQTLDLEASGPLNPADPRGLRVRGDVALRDVEVALPDFPPVTINGATELRNERIRQQLDARIGNSDATIRVDVHHWLALLLPETAGGRRTLARVDVRSALIDLDELLPEPAEAAEEETEPLARYPDWPPLDAEVTVALDRTRLMNLEMTGFSLRAALTAREAAADLGGSLYNGRFTSAIRLAPVDSADMNAGFRLDVRGVEANDFVSRLNDRVPVGNPLLRSLASADSTVFGRLDLDAAFTTHGLPAEFVDNLAGMLGFTLRDGRIVGVAWTRSLSEALAEKHAGLGYEQLEFGELRGDFRVENGNLLVDDFGFSGSPAGAMRAEGAVGFDNALDLDVTQTLPPAASRVVKGAGSALAEQLARATGVPAAADASLVPVDREGNALLYFRVDGTLSSPRVTLDAARMAREGTAGAARNAAGAAAQRAREEAAERAQRERRRLEAEARERLEAAREAAEAERKRLEEKAAEEAKKQAEKFFRR